MLNLSGFSSWGVVLRPCHILYSGSPHPSRTCAQHRTARHLPSSRMQAPLASSRVRCLWATSISGFSPNKSHRSLKQEGSFCRRRASLLGCANVSRGGLQRQTREGILQLFVIGLVAFLLRLHSPSPLPPPFLLFCKYSSFSSNSFHLLSLPPLFLPKSLFKQRASLPSKNLAIPPISPRFCFAQLAPQNYFARAFYQHPSPSSSSLGSPLRLSCSQHPV